MAKGLSDHFKGLSEKRFSGPGDIHLYVSPWVQQFHDHGPDKLRYTDGLNEGQEPPMMSGDNLAGINDVTTMALGEEGNPPENYTITRGMGEQAQPLPEVTPEMLEGIQNQIGSSPTRSLGENGSPIGLGGDDMVSKNMAEHGGPVDLGSNISPVIQEAIANGQPYSKSEGMEAINQPYSRNGGMEALNQVIAQMSSGDDTMSKNMAENGGPPEVTEMSKNMAENGGPQEAQVDPMASIQNMVRRRGPGGPGGM